VCAPTKYSNDTNTEIKIWDSETGKCSVLLNDSSDSINILLELSNRQLASGSFEIKIWDVNTCECLIRLNHEDEEVLCLIELPEGRLAGGYYDCTTKLWNMTKGELTHVLVHESPVSCLCLLKDGRLACGEGTSGYNDNYSTEIWDINSGNRSLSLGFHEYDITFLIQLRDGRLLSMSSCGTVKVWNVRDGSCEETLIHPSKSIACLIELSNGHLATGSCDGKITIWDPYFGTWCRRRPLLLMVKSYENRYETQSDNIFTSKASSLCCILTSPELVRKICFFL
jgi:WD40 repeat protein